MNDLKRLNKSQHTKYVVNILLRIIDNGGEEPSSEVVNFRRTLGYKLCANTIELDNMQA